MDDREPARRFENPIARPPQHGLTHRFFFAFGFFPLLLGLFQLVLDRAFSRLVLMQLALGAMLIVQNVAELLPRTRVRAAGALRIMAMFLAIISSILMFSYLSHQPR